MVKANNKPVKSIKIHCTTHALWAIYTPFFIVISDISDFAELVGLMLVSEISRGITAETIFFLDLG